MSDLEQLGDAVAGLGADAHRVAGLDADDLLDLADHPLGVRRRQVDLVDDRQHLQALLGRGVAVGDALRLDALRGVDHQQRPVAGGQRARDLVGEVHVTRRVDHVQLVALAVVRRVIKGDALRLDGDAALALEIHRVEHLRLHLAVGESAAQLDEAVGERRFAVIDVGDDGEVAYMPHESRGKLLNLAAPFEVKRRAHYREVGVPEGPLHSCCSPGRQSRAFGARHRS